MFANNERKVLYCEINVYINYAVKEKKARWPCWLQSNSRAYLRLYKNQMKQVKVIVTLAKERRQRKQTSVVRNSGWKN